MKRDVAILNGITFPLKKQVCSLGVLLDSSLGLDAQVAMVARSAFSQLKLVHQLFPFLEMLDLATVIHASVTSRLDYCNTLFVGLPLKTVQKPQLVQNSAARLLTGANYREHITHLLQELHWLPVCFQAQFKVLVREGLLCGNSQALERCPLGEQDDPFPVILLKKAKDPSLQAGF